MTEATRAVQPKAQACPQTGRPTDPRLARQVAIVQPQTQLLTARHQACPRQHSPAAADNMLPAVDAAAVQPVRSQLSSKNSAMFDEEVAGARHQHCFEQQQRQASQMLGCASSSCKALDYSS